MLSSSDQQPAPQSQPALQGPQPVDALFSRWTELTDRYATQLVLWEQGDLAAFETALALAPEIEHLRKLISGDTDSAASSFDSRPGTLDWP